MHLICISWEAACMPQSHAAFRPGLWPGGGGGNTFMHHASLQLPFHRPRLCSLMSWWAALSRCLLCATISEYSAYVALNWAALLHSVWADTFRPLSIFPGLRVWYWLLRCLLCLSHVTLHLIVCFVCFLCQLQLCAHLQMTHWIVGDQDDKLSQFKPNSEQLTAILSALTLLSNPFQSASSLSSEEAQLQASDFKSRLFKYYFLPQPPPGLQLLSSQAHLPVNKMTCMVSKLMLSRDMIVAAHILPKASAVTLLPSVDCQQGTTHWNFFVCSGASML